MADVPFSDFVTALALDTVGGSEKLPVVDGSTNKHVTPTVLSNYVIDNLVGATVITSLTDAHQFPVFTSADDEKIITGANLLAWMVDTLEAITTGSSIISGDTILYVDGGVLKQINIDDIIALVNSTNGTLGAQIAALNSAALADTDQYVLAQSGTAKKTTFVDLAARIHAQFNTFTAALSAVTAPDDSDKLWILQGSTAKYVTLTTLANTYLANEIDIEDFPWNMDEADPALTGDMLLMQRGSTRYKLDVDTLQTYFASGLQDAILTFSSLAAATPNAADLFVVDDGGTPKKITLSALEVKLFADYATYVTNLTAVVATTATDKIPVIQSGTATYVTPVELATYFGVGVGNVTGPVTTTENKIPQWDDDTKELKDGLTLVTTVRDSGTALDTAVPTEQAVREALSGVATAELDIDGMTAIGEALAGTDLFIVDHGANGTNRNSAISRIKTYIETAGTYDSLYIDAAAMAACSTNGAASGSTELGNGINLDYFAFDGGATEERVQFRMVMPEDWDRDTIKVRFFWGSATGSSTGDTVQWAIKAMSISDSDLLNASFESTQAVSDALLNDNGADLQLSGAVELTIGGTPALGDMVIFEIFRDTSADNMTEDAWLFGAQIQYLRNKVVAEWAPAVSASPSTSPSASTSSSPSTSTSTSPSTSTSTSPSTSASSTPSSSASNTPSSSPSAT
jgi:hypothetical protein